MTTVVMQFGDGTSKEIEVDATDPEEAVEEAKDWVSDNAWFEVYAANALDTLAEEPLEIHPRAPSMTEEERDVPAVQQAMKQLTQYINATDREVTRLTTSENRLTDQLKTVTDRLREVEGQLFSAREDNRRLIDGEKELKTQLDHLNARVEKGDESLRRRAEEAEERARIYGEQNTELREKAGLGERLSEASQKMIEAIERLPTKMEDAALIRAVVVDIPLYNTYEWQAVSDARFLLLRAMGESDE